MKAISVKHPWPWLMFHASPPKDIENRDWPTKYRGELWIHCSKLVDSLECDAAMALIRRHRLNIELPTIAELKRTAGHIIGRVTVTDCVRRSESPWFVGDYGFVLADPRPLVTPVYCRGSLGLWDVPELTRRVIEGQVSPKR